MKKNPACLLLFILIFSGCRKEFKMPSWEMNLDAALVYSDMGIEDIIPDSLLQVNSDNSINLVFDEKFFSYGIDSVVGIPDSTIRDSFVSILSTYAGPNTTIFTNTDNNSLKINSTELTHLTLQRGHIDYRVKSTVMDTVIVTYTITTGTLSGGPLEVNVTLPPGSPSSPTIVTGTYDLAGADLDLTGVLHNTVNSYQTKFIAKTGPGNTGVSMDINSRVSIEVNFKDMLPSYARGYFGHIIDAEPLKEQAFDFFKNLNTATVDLSHVDASLYISNGLGADARIKIDTVEAINTNTGADVLLSHSIIGQSLNINRAQDLAYAALPYVFSTTVNSSNSNIESFLESLPDKIRYKLSVELNPLGDVSGHTDFLYTNSRVEAGINLNIPLNFIASGLTLADTVDFNLDDYDQKGKILSGRVRFNIVNGLPLTANLKVMMLDENNMVIGNLIGPLNIGGNSGGLADAQTLYADLDASNIGIAYRAKKLVIHSTFATTPAGTFVSIYQTQRFKTQISVQADYLTNQE
jgi:hypothetical protein